MKNDEKKEKRGRSRLRTAEGVIKTIKRLYSTVSFFSANTFCISSFSNDITKFYSLDKKRIKSFFKHLSNLFESMFLKSIIDQKYLVFTEETLANSVE